MILNRGLAAPAQEDLVPVEVQVAALEMGKGLLDGGGLVFDAHPGEGVAVGAGRDQQEARILEADVALVEEVIDRRGQEQAVLAVQALLVVAVAPGLDVAADQVIRIDDFGDEGPLFGFRELGAWN